MNTRNDLFRKLEGFKNLSLDEQGELTSSLAEVLDRVADGVWQQHNESSWSCVFCCVSPQEKHDDNCPTTLARTILKNLSLDEQGELTSSLAEVLDRVADGVWQQHNESSWSCVFCCVSPQEKHDDNCPTTLARTILRSL